MFVKAKRFAEEAHKGQTRKYSGEPYFNHCERVAEIVREHFPGDAEIIAAAYLHDVLEDTEVTKEILFQEFGPRVSLAVSLLTLPKTEAFIGKDKDGKDVDPREQKLNFAITNFKNTIQEIKAIKLADILDNCLGLHLQDYKFAKIYYREKRVLIAEALFNGPKRLVFRALNSCCYV